MADDKQDRAWYSMNGMQERDEMLPSEALKRRRDEILAIMRRYESLGITNLRVFGSVSRGDDSSRSDVDFLVDAGKVSLLTLGGLQSELEDLLGVHVDLVPSDVLKDGMRDEILAGATEI